MTVNNSEKLLLKNRILGLLLRDARQQAGRSISDCAATLGIDDSAYLVFEAGQEAPTLPQLEVMAYFFNVPISHFWGQETLAQSRSEARIRERVPEVLMLRQKIVGARLRQLREKMGVSIAQIADQCGQTEGLLQAVEHGSETLPLNELEAVAQALGVRLEDLIDEHGPIGSWLHVQEEYDRFGDLSPEVRDFVLKPINRSYIELAMRLSEMETDRLRGIAESILEITY